MDWILITSAVGLYKCADFIHKKNTLETSNDPVTKQWHTKVEWNVQKQKNSCPGPPLLSDSSSSSQSYHLQCTLLMLLYQHYNNRNIFPILCIAPDWIQKYAAYLVSISQGLYITIRQRLDEKCLEAQKKTKRRNLGPCPFSNMKSRWSKFTKNGSNKISEGPMHWDQRLKTTIRKGVDEPQRDRTRINRAGPHSRGQRILLFAPTKPANLFAANQSNALKRHSHQQSQPKHGW